MESSAEKNAKNIFINTCRCLNKINISAFARVSVMGESVFYFQDIFFYEDILDGGFRI